MSAIFLTQSEARDFVRQLIGAVTFTGNIALWLQTGYFEWPANLKPLLHVWSLSIEEQYYMLLPAALVLTPRRYWLPATALLLILSLALCFAFASSKPSATFYLLPTRAWELALGSLAALLPVKPQRHKLLSWLVWPAAVLLIWIPAYPSGILQPWFDAAIVCSATLAVILARHPAFQRSPALWPLARIGDFSYSLYLVHWPLFAFANNAYVSTVPMPVNLGLLAVALGLGYALYRYVELPLRQAPMVPSKRTLGTMLGASIALVLISAGVTKFFAPAIDYAGVRRGNYGIGPECQFETIFRLTPVCSNSRAPTILVWGDSYAQHLVPGILASAALGLAQATKANCGALDGLAPVGERDYLQPWGRECLQFNQSVLDYLTTAGSVEYVVLSSAFGQYLGGKTWMRNLNLLRSDSGEVVEVEPGMSLAIERLRVTVTKLRAMGKRVVVVAPPPSSGFNVGQCLELKASGKVFLGADGDACCISVPAYRQQRARVREFLAKLPAEAAVNVVGFEDVLCSAQTCETELDGVFLYRDGGHLSVEGSKLVGIRMGLGERLLAAAR